jgi:hypothetical protein
MVPKPAILLALQEEIKHAKTCLRPSATGYIHTAISWMEYRVEQIAKELKEQHDKNRKKIY